MSDANQPALDLLKQAAATLPDVHQRKMFGWPALFSDRGIFAIVSESGRILVRLPDPAAFAELLAQPGAELWKMPAEQWQMTMEAKPVKHWLYLPTDFQDDLQLLEQWVRRAYDLSLMQPPTKRKRSS